MVSAKAILYKNKNTESLLSIDEREKPVSLQMFGSDPQIMAQIAKQIEERPFDILDINMGCPGAQNVNNGEGSAHHEKSDSCRSDYREHSKSR